MADLPCVRSLGVPPVSQCQQARRKKRKKRNPPSALGAQTLPSFIDTTGLPVIALQERKLVDTLTNALHAHFQTIVKRLREGEVDESNRERFQELVVDPLFKRYWLSVQELTTYAGIGTIADLGKVLTWTSAVLLHNLRQIRLSSAVRVRLVGRGLFYVGIAVERGADAAVLLPRAAPALIGCFGFLVLCASDQTDELTEHGCQVIHPDLAASTLNWLVPALASLLSPCKEARKQFLSSEGGSALTARVVKFRGPVRFLYHITNILDDEVLLVIHPRFAWAYRVRIAGISDIDQLLCLLSDELYRSCTHEGLPVDWSRPDEAAVAVYSARSPSPQAPGALRHRFTLNNWFLRLDPREAAGPLNNVAARIWRETTPADIQRCPLLPGQPRVAVITPHYDLKVQLVRDFAMLKPECETLDRLPDAAVRQVLAVLESVTEEQRERAIVLCEQRTHVRRADVTILGAAGATNDTDTRRKKRKREHK